MRSPTPFQHRQTAQDYFQAVRRHPALTEIEVAQLFELSPEEVARADAGDVTVWDTRLAPAFTQRLGARLKVKLTELEQQVRVSEDQAEWLRRLDALP